VDPAIEVRFLLVAEFVQGSTEVSPAQDLANKRIWRADTEICRAEAVSVDKSQQKEKDGTELFVYRLVFALVFVIAAPVV